ncbi:MAG: transglutaminase-like domain-containing protein [Fuerstiella sp.]|nr:transglutaminase-like domain-containing protein [Fuerstiella sp.]
MPHEHFDAIEKHKSVQENPLNQCYFPETGPHSFRRWMLWFVVVICLVHDCVRGIDTDSVRNIQLKAELKIRPAQSGHQIKIWIPVPQSSSIQTVTQEVRHESLPLRRSTEKRFGNSMLYGRGPISTADGLNFEIVWHITRQESRANGEQEIHILSDETRALWMTGSKKVPIGGRPLELIDAAKLPVDSRDRARMFYHRVLDHLSYDKSRPGYGTGDAVWACESRFGNCTDFHSLFMSLARSHNIPARFEIGYSLPRNKTTGRLSGYHCWAWFFENRNGWTPVDISEAEKNPEQVEYCFGNLSVDRVGFSIGRDLILEPPQKGPPLNYFVKPYVEADGMSVDDVDVYFSLSFFDIDTGAPE